MRIERTATSISWIPSESIPGLLRMPFAEGLMHYDPPPPLEVTDLEPMRQRGEFRFANRLRAWVEVDGGRIRECGYDGGIVPGLTRFTAGPLRVMLPSKVNPDIQWAPRISGSTVTFVQTAGNRPGFSVVRPSLRWPFLVTRPFTIWTTVELTIDVDGPSTQRLVGASPFPRHWLYDAEGRLVEKAALTRNKLWFRTVFGRHTPWGGEDEAPVVAEAETVLERVLSEQIMQGSEQATVRTLAPDELLFRQSDPGSSIALLLDGLCEVVVDGDVVGRIGPGAVVGERAGLEAGRRTADVRAITEARVGEIAGTSISPELLSQLSSSHQREHQG
jgi:hypothetical protein